MISGYYYYLIDTRSMRCRQESVYMPMPPLQAAHLALKGVIRSDAADMLSVQSMFIREFCAKNSNTKKQT